MFLKFTLVDVGFVLGLFIFKLFCNISEYLVYFRLLILY